MTDMLATIVPKSDRINADDLTGRTLTIKVTKVLLSGEAEQPVSIAFEGDGGKPWYPCKSMRRVLVNLWGPDANAYVGRSITLYRDDTVTFGALKVGGIRISHMSNIDGDKTMALTATRAQRKPYTVKPLKVAAEAPRAQKATITPEPQPDPPTAPPLDPEDVIALDPNDWADTIERHLDLAPDRAAAIAIFTEAAKETEWAALKIDDPTRATALRAKVTDFGKGKA